VTCDRCGSRTTTGASHCRDCQRDERRDDDAASGYEAFDCPDCGGPTSGEDVTCYKCRKDDDAQEQEIATDGGRIVDVDQPECPNCDASRFDLDGRLTCIDCGYTPRASVREQIRAALDGGSS
jgi:ribosomal protein S27AE